MVIKEFSREGQSRLSLSGRFDFSTHRDFREAYQKLIDSRVKHITIDLGGVEYLDSSALGMLLQLKDKADQVRTKIVLESRNSFVNDILATAKFDKIFEVKR